MLNEWIFVLNVFSYWFCFLFFAVDLIKFFLRSLKSFSVLNNFGVLKLDKGKEGGGRDE